MDGAAKYASALGMNPAFISGEHPCNINDSGPVRAEKEEIIPGPLKLHDHGISPHTPQPFYYNECEFIDQQDQWWEKWRRLPSWSFLLPQQDHITKQAVEKYCLLLLAHPAILANVAYYDADKSFRTNIDVYHPLSEWRPA